MDCRREFIEEKGYSYLNNTVINEYALWLEQKLTETNQALQLLQPDVITSVCICKVCDKPFGDTLSLWEHFYHNHIKQTEC